MDCEELEKKADEICADPAKSATECHEAIKKVIDCRHARGIGRAMEAATGKAVEEALEFVDCMKAGGSFAECWGIFTVPKILYPDPRTIHIRNEIFENSKNVMIFSEHLEKAFAETGIKLEDDETFACQIFVQKKPQFISQVIRPSIGPYRTEYSERIEFILNPKIMGQVLESFEKDKIK